MEILSAGEKIKRTRIYKGLTLKDICGDRISVSKMSCIENNKVEPEDWILEIIVDKLGLDMEYLKYSVRDQIVENIGRFSSCDRISLDEVLRNVDYSEKYEYHDLTCKLFEILFEYYLNHGMTSELSTTIPRYYNACQKSKDEKLHTTYYIYIAKYLYANREFSQAGSYIASVRRKLIELGMNKSNEYIRATYNQVVVYIQCGDIEKAKENAKEFEEILAFNKDEFVNAEIYKILTIIEVYSKGENINKYMEEALKRYNSMEDKKAAAYFDIGEALIKNENKEDGICYIKKALIEYPRNNKEQVCEFLINGIEILIQCEQYDVALQHTEEVLNISIEMNLVPGMDKAYYYKSVILEKQKNYVMAESYIMLSLDALLKYGNKIDIYKRYMKIGRMYHKMGETKDAIRYFDLAFKVDKSIV